MSLTIFPQAFSVGFTPKASPPASQPKGIPPDVQPNTPPDVDTQVELNSIKIIPDEENSGASNAFSAKNPISHRTAFRINSDSNDVVVKLIDQETGETVREIPDTKHQELSRRIREYQDLAFEQPEQQEEPEQHQTG